MDDNPVNLENQLFNWSIDVLFPFYYYYYLFITIIYYYWLLSIIIFNIQNWGLRPTKNVWGVRVGGGSLLRM